MKQIKKAFLLTVATAGLTSCSSRIALAEQASVPNVKTEVKQQAIIDSIIISAPFEAMHQSKYKPVAGFDTVQKQGFSDLFKPEPRQYLKKPFLGQ